MNKKLASQQYASNQMGSNPGPGLGQRIKNLFKGSGKPKGHPGAVTMECSKDGCGSMNAGGGKSNVGRETNRQNKGGAKGLSTKAQYSKKIVNKEKEAKKMEKIRTEIKKANTPKKLKAKF